MTDLICIRKYNSRIEAELAKGLLETSGIKAVVSADDAGGMRPHLLLGDAAVRLSVKEEDEEKAVQLLEDAAQQ